MIVNNIDSNVFHKGSIDYGDMTSYSCDDYFGGTEDHNGVLLQLESLDDNYIETSTIEYEWKQVSQDIYVIPFSFPQGKGAEIVLTMVSLDTSDPEISGVISIEANYPIKNIVLHIYDYVAYGHRKIQLEHSEGNSYSKTILTNEINYAFLSIKESIENNRKITIKFEYELSEYPTPPPDANVVETTFTVRRLDTGSGEYWWGFFRNLSKNPVPDIPEMVEFSYRKSNNETRLVLNKKIENALKIISESGQEVTFTFYDESINDGNYVYTTKGKLINELYNQDGKQVKFTFIGL